MLLRMVGWSFLPDMGARMLLQFYRQLSVTLPPKFGFKASVPPPEGSPEHMKQKRISFSVVIFLYLLYTTAQSYTQAPPNFYALLDVSPAVDEPTLKTAFRNYARFNHPDRVGASGEARFIAARDAFDTLKSSTKRWAYDRFGPEVIGWEKECTSLGDYIERGLMASCGFYLVSAVAMVLYAIFGQSGFGAFVSFYFRPYLCFIYGCFIVEIQHLFHPYRLGALAHPLTTFLNSNDLVPWTCGISAHQVLTSAIHLTLHRYHTYRSYYSSVILWLSKHPI